MAHTSRCGGAKTIRCRCSCEKILHAGGLGILGLNSHSVDPQGVSAPEDSPERTLDLRRKAMKEAQDQINTWLAGALMDPPATVAAATSQAMDQIRDVVGGAVSNTLNRQGHKVDLAGHDLCDFLAALACAMIEFKKELDRYSEYMVKLIKDSRLRNKYPRISDEAVTLAAKAAIAALMKLPVLNEFEKYLRVTQLLAVGLCPTPKTHTEVASCCLNPLAGTILSKITTQGLMTVLPQVLLSGT